MSKRFFLIYLLPLLLTACADFYGAQPPAPVFGGHPADHTPNSATPGQTDTMRPEEQAPDQTVSTEPLKESPPSQPESIEFKPEPEPPVAEPEEQAEDQAPSPTQSPAQIPNLQAPAVKPEAEQFTLTPFEPMEISTPLSPAVGALVVAANQNTSSGNLEAASATIERAIRIEPRNANLFYKLALIRIKQSKPRLAEDLAKKSALLAANDRTLKKHSWLLIAHVRELQKNFKGAKEARAKANRI